MLRFVLGATLGFCLAGQSLWFIGVGHGSAVPVFFALSVLGFVVASLPLSALIAGPILWGVYFLLVPDIANRRARILILFIALLSHVTLGALMAVADPAFQRIDLYGSSALIFAATFLAAIGSLTWISLRH